MGGSRWPRGVSRSEVAHPEKCESRNMTVSPLPNKAGERGWHCSRSVEGGEVSAGTMQNDLTTDCTNFTDGCRTNNDEAARTPVLAAVPAGKAKDGSHVAQLWINLGRSA
jgi:hypothetical protein